ncbi:hypothetical protein L3C95_14185 [Chitinophaga filiformis]|nr:hypothetical protein [Chitinophaga filiformis]
MEKAPELKDTDLRAEITSTEKLIEYIYGQRDILEGHMPHAGFKPLQPSLDITSEIITVLHSILRILQKNTLKPPLTNKTEEATLAVNRSKKTINKLYDR